MEEFFPSFFHRSAGRRTGLFLLIFLTAQGCNQGPARPENVSLETALAGARPGAGRLAGIPWEEAPPAAVRPRAGPHLAKALAQAGHALKKRRNAGTLRNHAILLLAAGRTDHAVAELAEATVLSPADAVSWSDLAAARLLQSSIRSDPHELVLALAAADRAVRHDPGLLAARFNRALALAHLSLDTAANREWQHVLRHERDPLWRREAQSHAMAVAPAAGLQDWNALLKQAEEEGPAGGVAEIVAGSPQKFREYVEETLLPAWAVAEGEHREHEAQKLLNLARRIGQDLAAVNNERMAADTIAQIDRTWTSEPQRRESLVRGFTDHGKGFALTREGDFSGALAHFELAHEVFADQGSPFAGWAAFQAAFCHYQLLEYGKAKAVLRDLLHEPALQRYRSLQGRALLLRGLMEIIEGDPGAALATYRTALSHFSDLREKPSVAKLGVLMAGALDSLGRRVEAWRTLHPALMEPETFDQPKIRSAACETAFFLAQEQGEFEIALQFNDEVLLNAFAPYAAIEALRGRAGLLAALGRIPEASQAIAQARRTLERIPDPQSARSLEGALWLAEAEIASHVSPQETLEALDKAIPFLRRSDYRFRLVEAHTRRALAEEALNRLDDAERDLSAALQELERQRENIEPPQERSAYLDRSREVFDRMIRFQLARRSNPMAALRFSEQAKARVLWDWILAHPGGPSGPQGENRFLPGPVDLDALVESLPAGSAILHYTVLPESTILWMLRRGETPRSVMVDAGAEALDSRIGRLHRTLRSTRRAAFQTVSQELYDLLITPAAGWLAPGERLVFIPDGALHKLPFATLLDRRTGRYLVQNHVLSVAPSLRVFVASLRRDADLPRTAGPRVLVAAAPEHDRELYRLDLLEAAATEAAVIKTFPGSRVLRGANATRRRFLASVRSYDIVHFGGHSVVNTERPLFSHMIFARDSGDPSRGVLYSGDLLRRRFDRARLVVLASCNTAAGKISRTEGVESLARPFLAAGVPSVIASLWAVEDSATSEFFARFYTNLEQRPDVAAALQATQIEAIEHGSPETSNPRSWGAFEVIGSNLAPDPPQYSARYRSCSHGWTCEM